MEEPMVGRLSALSKSVAPEGACNNLEDRRRAGHSGFRPVNTLAAQTLHTASKCLYNDLAWNDM
jgi:hypothetical protein